MNQHEQFMFPRMGARVSLGSYNGPQAFGPAAFDPGGFQVRGYGVGGACGIGIGGYGVGGGQVSDPTNGLDPIGELLRVFSEVGARFEAVGYENAVATIQRVFHCPQTGAVDGCTVTNLDAWGSTFSARLEALLQALGAPSEGGFDPALKAVQRSNGLPESGVIDFATANLLYDAAERLRETAIATIPAIEAIPLYPDTPAGPQTGPVGTAIKSFVRRVPRDPKTLIGIVGSIVIRAAFPSLTLAPILGVLFWELSDEVRKVGA